MGYDVAVEKAWDEFIKLSPPHEYTVKFLADEYAVDLEAKK